MRQIITRWVVPGSSGNIQTVMNFADNLGDINDQRQAVQDFWLGFTGLVANGVSWTVETSGRVLNTQTGNLENEWFDQETMVGPPSAGTGQVVANATMVLVRWRTDTIAGGRRVQGRTFVPGLSVGQMSDGQLTPTAQGFVNTAAADFVAKQVGFGIWSRPSQNAGGQLSQVISGSAWGELATQRRRRG